MPDLSLSGARPTPTRIIELAHERGINPTADMVADALIPDRLPEDHPDYLTERDPWSVAWDEADDLLHPKRPRERDDEFPLPRTALMELPQEALADIFHAQRKLLAELQDLRDKRERLQIALFWQYRRWGVPEAEAWENVDATEDGRLRHGEPPSRGRSDD